MSIKWNECMRVIESFGYSRFSWPGGGFNGFDCDEAITINDVWGLISWAWTWPGDWLLSQAPVQTFLAMEPGTVIGSWWSTAIGWFLFLTVINLAGQR
jgi:hypothetical protein